MGLRKFGDNDVFVNVVKTKPHSKFSIYNGGITYSTKFSNSVTNGYAALYDLNLNIVTPVPTTCNNELDFSETCNTQYIPLV